MFGVKLDRYGDDVQFSGNIWPRDNNLTLGTASKSWYNAYIQNISGNTISLTSATGINISAAGAISISSSGDIALDAEAAGSGGEITLTDDNRNGSTWVATKIKFSDTTAEWNTFKTNFGEVSLLNAINQSGYWDRAGTILSPNTAGDTVQAGIGTVDNPSYAGTVDPDTGFRFAAGGRIDIISAGSAQWYIRASDIRSATEYGVYIRQGVGVEATPSYAFQGQTDMGMYRKGEDNLAFSTNATEKLGINDNALYTDNLATIDLDCTSTLSINSSSGNITLNASDNSYFKATQSDNTNNCFIEIYSDNNGGSSGASRVRLRAESQAGVAQLELMTHSTVRLSIIDDAAAFSNLSTFDLDASGAISINSTGGAINIGNDADEQDINIGTGNATRTITIGDDYNATVVNIDAADDSHFIVNGHDLTLETTGSNGIGNTYIKGGGEVRFTDGNMTAWAKGYIELSATASDWTTYESNFGEVSLMNAISQAFASFDIYSQAAEPALSDSTAGFWRDTDDDSIWLLFKYTGLTQVKVQLS